MKTNEVNIGRMMSLLILELGYLLFGDLEVLEEDIILE